MSMNEVTVCFFNANNLYLRYRFGRGYPGDRSGKSYTWDHKWGFLPWQSDNSFEFYNGIQTELAAKAIRAGGKPEIVCLCEVESMLALRTFNEQYFDNFYQTVFVLDSLDPRQIDVGFMTTLPLKSVRTHIYDKSEAGQRIFSRDCLEVDFELPGGKTLTILINHFKSKFIDTKDKSESEISDEHEANNARRMAQADRVVDILKERFVDAAYQTDYFMVVGDLNDQPDSLALEPVVKNADLFDALQLLDAEDRWTYFWQGKREVSQIDYFLLSPALQKLIEANNVLPRIERRGLAIDGISYSGEKLRLRPDTVTLKRFDADAQGVEIAGFDKHKRFVDVLNKGVRASDHCPIFIDIPIVAT